MKQLGKLFSANFKMTFREKQVWFWSIFYPVLLMVIFLTFFGGSDDASFEAKIAVAAEKESAFSSQIVGTLKQIPVLEWKEEQPVSRGQAEAWVKEKEIDAAIVLPDSPDGKRVTLLVNKEKENSMTAQALSGILNDVLTRMNYAQANLAPQYSLTTETVSAGSEKLKYRDFLLTGMIALAISQAGLFGMVGMVEMRRNGLLKRLMLAPVNMRMFGFSNMLVRFILSAIQIVLLSLIGVLFYKASLDIRIVSFVLMFVVGTVSFAAMGFLIAAFSKSMESYMGIANLFSFIMMFISGIFFEYSMLPSYIKPLADVLPLTYFVNGIRDTMVYGYGFTRSFWLNIGVLLAWTAVSFLIASKFYKWKADAK